jgi:hypothetical protein
MATRSGTTYKSSYGGQRDYVKEAQRMVDLASDHLDGREDHKLRDGLSEVIDGIVELFQTSKV